MTCDRIWLKELDKKEKKAILKNYDFQSKEENSYILYKNTLRTVPDLLRLFLAYGKNSDLLLILE